MSIVVMYVADSDHPGSKPGTVQPAYRAWADALVVQAAASAERSNASLVSIRPTAQIARLEPIGRYSNPITVDESKCAAAPSSDLLRIYFPLQWSESLLEFLEDCRFSRDLVEELVLPCSAPMVPVNVSKIFDVLLETPGEILDAIKSYFAADIVTYIESVRSIDGAPLSEDWEVLIPA